MRTTSVEHETDERKPARAAEAQRPDMALPLHARMLLGLQGTAGNAAVADLIETRKPTEISAPPLAESGVREEAVPAPVTAEAPPSEEAAVAPHAGETDDELAALDADADNSGPEHPEQIPDLAETDATSPPPLAGEGGVGAADPGSPIEERPAEVPPDVSGVDPAAGLARVGSLPPARLLSSLETVSTAVDRQAATEHERLAASAPQRQRHPGAPATVESPPATRLALAERAIPSKAPTMPEARDAPVRPRGDTLPHLPLEGNADPALVHQQHASVLSSVEREHVSGRQDATRPLGEDEIFPTAPVETLRGSIGETPSRAGAAPTQPKPAEDDEAASIIAQQEKGAEIQSAVGTGLASLAGQREEYAQRTVSERARADAEMSQLEQGNSQEQASERGAAQREVAGLRGQWTTAQQALVVGAQGEAQAKTSEVLQTVAKERGAAEQEATAHYEQGQREAQKTRQEAEQQAATERKKAQGQNQGGLLGAIGSAAQSLFDKAKQAVQSVFDLARQLVRSAIERAQQLATAVMERARQAIVGAIRMAGTVLTAIGDRVLVAFPALHARFRKAIQDRIAAAEATVNRLANALKHAVQTALNLVGTVLSAAIGLLHQGMLAALDGVRAAVHGALDFARGALAAFGTFAVLVKDIAANPGRWVANLAAAVKDGIQNYLWVEIKTAVQGWFQDKVHEVVGVGEAIWHLLQRGGISIAEVAGMAWEGLKAAIPGILIALLIEKLMSLIVPAVGAILTIIQAIQAGWASLGRILQAFDAFFNFLKHVKLGSAGPLFAKAVAAGAIAAVEFVSNFLLTRLKGAASSVSNRLRALARRIGERLRAIGNRVLRGVKAVGSGLRRAGQKVRTGFDRLRGKRPQSPADREAAKRRREEAALTATKAKLDALFTKGISRARLAAYIATLKIRYRWSSLGLQGAPEAKNVEVVGGFSPKRHVTSGPIRDSESLEALIGEDLIGQAKLRFVRKDPFIDADLKADFIRKVEARLRDAKSRRLKTAPYEVMNQVVAENIQTYRLLGDPITSQQLQRLGGVSRVISLEYIWDKCLALRYKGRFRDLEQWITVLRSDPLPFVPRLHLLPSLVVSGQNDIGFWYARYRSFGATTAKYVTRLQLSPERYPYGALRFEMKTVPTELEFRRPTAFDGMPHPEWAPALRRDAVWGIVPGSLPKVREAVSGPVPLASMTGFGLVLP